MDFFGYKRDILTCVFVNAPHECERAKVSRKSSQVLGVHAATCFKAVIRENLTRDNEATTEDAALDENNVGPGAGRLKGITTRSKPSSTQSQVTNVPQESLSAHEEVETPLDGLHTSTQFIATSISYETCCREAILNNGTDKKPLMKEVNDVLQVQCKCVFHVVKLDCNKQFEPEVDE